MVWRYPPVNAPKFKNQPDKQLSDAIMLRFMLLVVGMVCLLALLYVFFIGFARLPKPGWPAGWNLLGKLIGILIVGLFFRLIKRYTD